VRQALGEFLGEIEQVPPMFSAVKQDGVPLHKLARRGREVERSPKRVSIDRLEILAYAAPDLDIEVGCSAGTYVRVLAADLGARLGCGAHLAALRRTRSGPFEIEAAATPAQLADEASRGGIEACIVPAVSALGMPVVRLEPEEVRQVSHGREIQGSSFPLDAGVRVAALEPGGELLAVLEVRPGRWLKPLRVLRSLAPQG